MATINNQPSLQYEVENVCNHLLAENGGVSMRDLDQVISIVKSRFPDASEESISLIAKSNITE